MKKFKKLILIVMIVAMLSNYFAIIGEIGSQVFASEEGLASSLELTMSDESLVEENKEDIEKENPYKREMFGDSMDLKSVLDNGERYKGILLANKLLDEEHRKEFEFKSSLELNIKKYAELDSFVIDESEFVITGGERISFSNYIEIKYISIPENEFKELFDSTGYILILNDKGEEVAIIDSNLTPVDGSYRLDFVKGVSNLKFKVAGLKSNGALNLEIGKNIAKEIPYTREEIELFDEIIVADKVKATINDTAVVEETSENTEPAIDEKVDSLSTENTVVNDTENTVVNDTENTVVNDTENTVVESLNTENTMVESKEPEEIKSEEISEKTDHEITLSVDNESEKTEPQKEVEPEIKETPKNDSLTLDLGDTEKYYNFIDVINAEKTELHSEDSLILDMASEEKVEEVASSKEEVEEVASSKEEVLEIENEIKLNKSETKVVLEMSKYEIGTKEAQEISFNVKLMSNSEKYDIFKDPFVEILFPSEIEKVEVENVNVLYKNGIDIESYLVEKNAVGQNVLRLVLSGVQDDYATGLIDGITVKFDASIETGKMVTSHKSNIMYRYSNEYANHIVYQENGLDSESVDIEFVGDSGLLKSTKITDLDSNVVIADSYNEDRKVEKIENKEKLNILVESTFVNNYGKDIEGITIQGKTIDADIFETIQTEAAKSFEINGAITCDKVNAEIYYSGIDGTDIDSSEWTKDISSLNSVKEFKIVFGENEVMHHGDKVVVSYNLKIDDEISYNEQITYKNIINYIVDGEKSKDTTIFGIETEKKEASVEDLITYSLIKTDIEKPESDVVIDIVNNDNNISEIEEPVKNNDVPSISDVIEEQEPETIDEVMPEEQPETVDNSEENIEPVTDEDKTIVEEEPTINNEATPEVEDANMSDVLKVGTQVMIRNDEITNGSINERQVAKVRVAMKNISNKPLTNVRLEGKANNANIYYFDTFEMESDTTYEMVTVGRYEEDTEGIHTSEIDEIPVINPGEEHVFEYQTVVKALNELSSEDKDFYGKVSIQADGMKETDIETEKYKVEDADIELKLMTGNYENINQMGIPSGTGFAYYTGGFKNISSQKMENIKMHFILPENMHLSPLNAYEETVVMKEYPSTNGSIVEVIVPELEAGLAYTTILTVTVDRLPIEVSEIYSTVGLSVIANGKEYKGNDVTRKVYQVQSEFETKLESDSEGKILKDGDTVRYTYTAKNIGSIAQTRKFDMMFSSAVTPTAVTLYRQDGTVEELEADESSLDTTSNFLNTRYRIEPNEEVRIAVKAVYNAEDLIIGNDKIQAEVYSENNLGISNTVDTEILKLDSELYLAMQESIQDEDEDIDEEMNDESTFYTEYYDGSDEEDIEETNDMVENPVYVENEENALELPIENTEDIGIENIEENPQENDSIISNVEKLNYIEVYVDEDVSIKDYTQGKIVNRNLPMSVMDNQEGEEESNSKNNIIRGFVWVDKIGEGYYDSQDRFLEGVIVKLFDTSSNAIVESTYTDERGKYEFENIDDGKYAVLFSYDKERYGFVKDEPFDKGNLIASNINQDRVIDGVNYAISDSATISKTKGANINLGLKEKDNFDLSIDGYIEKLGNDDFTYKLENGQKTLEIRKKDSRKDIRMQYKIILKNNGNIDGLVDRISLELPEGASFDAESNPNWELVGNKIIYKGTPIGVTIDGNNSLIINIKGKINDLLKSEIKIEKSTPAKIVSDSNLDNDRAVIELKVHSNIDVIKIIIISMVITIIFVIALVINKNSSNGRIKVIVIIYILAITLNILGNVAYGMNYKDLVARGMYWNGSDDEDEQNKEANHIQNWAAGRDVTHESHNGKEAHAHITEYMNNFYGAGNTRTALLNWNGFFVRDFMKTRNNYCMQGSNVSYAGTSASNDLDGYRLIAAIDIGYNNGYSQWINCLYGTRNGKLYNGSTGGTWRETSDQAQTMAAMAWNADTNQYKVQNEYQCKQRYFYALRYTLTYGEWGGFKDSYDNGHYYNTNINASLQMTGNNWDWISCPTDAVSHHGDDEGTDYAKDMKYIDGYQTAFQNAYWKNKATFNQTWVGLGATKVTVDAANKIVEDEVYSNYVTKSGSTGSTYFAGPIKVKIPSGTTADSMKNETVIHISANGKTIKYEGNLYLYNSTNKRMEYAYNCKGVDLSVVNNKNFYIPQSSITKALGVHDEYSIKISNSFYYYQARLLYLYQTRFKEPSATYCNSHDVAGQNKAVMRGRRMKASSNDTVTWKPGTAVEISKSVYSINDNVVGENKTAYVENGDTIKYKVTLKCIKGTAKLIEFTDQFGDGKLNNFFQYVNCENVTHVSQDATTKSHKYRYSTKLGKNKTATVYLSYKVKDSIDNERNSNKPIKNTVNITKVTANMFKPAQSKLTASATAYMKIYKVGVKKYITKVVHNGQTTYTSDRNSSTDLSKFGAPVSVEVGDEVHYRVEILNLGDNSNKYGKFKVTNVIDTYDEKNLKTSATDVCKYNKAKNGDKIYENSIDSYTKTGNRITNANYGSALGLDGLKMEFNSLGNTSLGERPGPSYLSVIYTDGVDDEVFADQQYYYEIGNEVTKPKFIVIDPNTSQETEVEEPIWKGHKFVDWEIIDDENGAEGDKIYRATWKELQSVTFTDGDDDEVVFDDVVYYYEYGEDEEPQANFTPTRANHRFDGWKQQTIEGGSEGNKLYSAEWTRYYSVTYEDGAGGTVFPNIVYEEYYPDYTITYLGGESDETDPVDAEEVVDDERDQTTDEGVEDNGENSGSQGAEEPEENVEYIVNFNNLPSPQFDENNVPVTSNGSNTPSREGYLFVKWEESTDPYIPEENNVFVAIWEPLNPSPDDLENTSRIITYTDGQGGIRFSEKRYTTINDGGVTRDLQDGDPTPLPNLSDSEMVYDGVDNNGNAVKYVLVGWNPSIDEFVGASTNYVAIWEPEGGENINEDNELPQGETPKPTEEPSVPEEGSSASYSLSLDDDSPEETVTISYEKRDEMQLWKNSNDGSDIMDKANHIVSSNKFNGGVNTVEPGKSITYDSVFYVDFSKNIPTNEVMNFSRIQKITIGNGLSDKVLYYSQNYVQGTDERKLMETNSTYKSVDYIKIKPYSITINKSICAITNKNGNQGTAYSRENLSEAEKSEDDIYADVGDLVVYKIAIKNNDGSSYGSIKNVRIKDKFIETFVHEEDGLEVNGFNDVAMTFKDAWAGNGANITTPIADVIKAGDNSSTSSSCSWTKNGDYYTCTTTIAPGETKYLYIRYSVEKHTKLIEKVWNVASVVEIQNTNGKSIMLISEGDSETTPIYRKAIYDSVIESSDYYTIKRYKVEVDKKIVSVDGVAAENIGENFTCEVGDIIVYSVTITNTGTEPSFGTIKQINIKDIFNTPDHPGWQEYINAEPPEGWTVDNPNSQDIIILTKDAGIAPGDSITFIVKMKVTLRDTGTGNYIRNKAKIDTDNAITNRNDINIRDVLLGKLEDEVSLRYLTYRIDIRKYINGQGQVNGKDRKDLTNKEKYDNPVLFEQTNTGTYVIRIKNTGETVLYGVIIDDILDQGLTFYNAGTEASINRIEYQSDEEAIPTNVTAEFVKDIDSSNRLCVAVKTNAGAYQGTSDQTITPGSILSIYIDFRVDDSNLHLWNLENEVNVIGLVNKHNIEIIMDNSDILALDRNDNKDYVRLNDVPINGVVWNDVNKNGIMETGEPKIQGVTVRLIDKTNNKYIETMTNANGKYTFPTGNGYSLTDGSESTEAMVLPEGRVVKATNRNQTTGNYYLPTKDSPTPYVDKYAIYKTDAEKTLESSYINYIVEYEYNGARFKATNNYAGDSNINQTDFTMEEAYHTDSNAVEYSQMRENFANRLETINYNNAVSSNGTGNKSERLFYDKEGHVSTIIDDLSEDKNDALKMQAYSFVTKPDDNVTDLSDIIAGNRNDNSGNIKYLWLNRKNEVNNRYCYEGDTEYLKEINLGLKVQEFDLKLEKDLYQVKTLVGGYEATYDYNQGNNGPVKAADYVGMYATGGKEQDGVFTTNNYQFKLYSSDYEYRNSKYENLDVRNYMSGTELDVEVTYKITVTNDKENINDDKQHLYAVVNEIADFYPTEFVNYNKANNTKKQKYYDRSTTIADQLLKTRDVYVTEAWYVDKDGVKHDLTTNYLSNESNHKITYNGVEATDNSMANQNKTFNGYNKMYISGLNNVILDWNDKFDIYVKYTVDRNTDESRNLKINKGNALSAVAEINSYSTYQDDAKTNPAGYIDINSNPGNVGYNETTNTFDTLNNYKEYENDTYRAGLIFDIDEDTTNNKVSERAISGFIWDDARSQSVGAGEEVQYVGDGTYNESISKDANARVNPLFDEKAGYSSDFATRFNPNRENKDNPVGGMKVKLIQLVTVDTDSDGKADRIYEETVNYSSLSEVVTASGQDGKFMLSGFIPGKYIVRYEYGGETTNNANRDAMIVYNGQDYKSTVYNEDLDSVEITNTNNVESTDGDIVLEKLTGKFRALGTPEPATKSIQSDARDDAIRRLEVNGYSEYVTNDKSNALQISKLQTDGEMNAERKTLYKKRLLDNTSMYADTPMFPVRPEDDKYLQSIEYTFDEHTGITTSENRYMLSGIDFGIEYRPEADIDVEKHITEVKVMTGPEKVLYDLKFDIHDTDDKAKAIPNTRIGSSVLNRSTSVGVANAQILRNNIQASTKGFIYLNIDADVMKGTTVMISYIINVNNISEVDRISETLRRILYEESVRTGALATEYDSLVDMEPTGYMPDGTPESDPRHYRALITARNKLNSQFNVAIPNGVSNKVRLARAEDGSELVRTSDNYYGVYLGNTYYTGTISGRNTAKADGTRVNYNAQDDRVSMMKIAGILDYVDNDMTFEQNDNNSENNYWRKTVSQELAARGYIDEETFVAKDGRTSGMGSWGSLLLNMISLVDNKGRKYDADNNEVTDEQTGAKTNNSRLALVVDDSGKGAVDETTKNVSITRFLVPEGGNTNKPASSAYVYINTIKVIDTETDTKNLQFDNVAEVVEYRTETGRVTTMLSHSTKSTTGKNTTFNVTERRSSHITLGNAKLRMMDEEYLGDNDSKTNEPDTGITEVVTLIPPTGSYKLAYYLATHRDLLRFFKVLFVIMLITPVLIIVFKKAKNYKKVYK